MIDEVEKRFAAAGAPVTFIKVHHQPDGHFPNGIPNPLLPECRQTPPTRCAHQRTWGSPLTATSTAASCSMTRRRLSRVLHCRPAGGGVPAETAGGENHSRPASDVEHGGHRDPQRGPAGDVEDRACVHQGADAPEDAIYGGEMSAHHYFRDFAYCDSGMIPWLLVAELLCLKNSSLKSLVADRQRRSRRRGDQPQAGKCGGGDSAHPGAV